MIKFTLEDKQYEIPEIMTIGHYVKMYKMKDLFSDDYYAAKLVNLFTGAKVEDLLETDFEKVNYLASEIMKLIPQERPAFKDRFELDGVHYGFFPQWQDLSFAEFVDMDTISSKKEDELLDMLHLLCAIMYRPIVTERSLHDFDIEKYDIKSMKIRAELFKNKLEVGVILAAQFFFYQLRKQIFQLFPAVFDQDAVNMDEDKAVMDVEESANKRSFQSVYGWFIVVNRLASNDFTKHETIYQKTVVEVLNQLSFLINYDQEQDRLSKQAQGAV